MAKNTVVFGDNGVFKIERTDKAGKVSAQVENGNVMLEVAQCVRLVTGAIKGQQTMSDAWQSLIVRILDSRGLDEYRGAGDRETGKTSTTFKDAIRKAEDAYFDQLAHDKVAGIPVSAEKRNEMVKAMRNDNNYSNIRSTCAKYFAFVGALPVTQSGYLIPRPIMLEQIKGVLNVKPEDTSLRGRIVAMLPEVESCSDDKELKAAIVAMNDLLAKAKARIDHIAEVATNAMQHLPPTAGSTPTIASEAIGKAKRAKTPAAQDVVTV